VPNKNRHVTEIDIRAGVYACPVQSAVFHDVMKELNEEAWKAVSSAEYEHRSEHEAEDCDDDSERSVELVVLVGSQ